MYRGVNEGPFGLARAVAVKVFDVIASDEHDGVLSALASAAKRSGLRAAPERRARGGLRPDGARAAVCRRGARRGADARHVLRSRDAPRCALPAGPRALHRERDRRRARRGTPRMLARGRAPRRGPRRAVALRRAPLVARRGEGRRLRLRCGGARRILRAQRACAGPASPGARARGGPGSARRRAVGRLLARRDASRNARGAAVPVLRERQPRRSRGRGTASCTRALFEPRLSQPLQAILTRALERDPSRRYPHAGSDGLRAPQGGASRWA